MSLLLLSGLLQSVGGSGFVAPAVLFSGVQQALRVCCSHDRTSAHFSGFIAPAVLAIPVPQVLIRSPSPLSPIPARG